MLWRIIVLFVATSSLVLHLTEYGFSLDTSDKKYDAWNPVSAGPLTAWTAPVCAKGTFVIQPFLFYNRTRGTFNADGLYNSLPNGDEKYQFQEQLFAQYGLTDRIEVCGQIVYQENYIKQGITDAHAYGFGDSYLFLRYCALEEKGLAPHITGLFQLKIPTGKYEHADPDRLGTDLMGAGSGGGSWDQGLGINISKKVKPCVLHADAVYSFPQQVHIDGVKTRYAHYLTYDLGVEYFLPNNLNLMIEMNGFVQGDKQEDGVTLPDSHIRYVTIAPGIGWSNDVMQTLIVYQRVAAGTNTDANDSIIFTFVYTL